MSAAPTVDIVLPVHDGEKFLQEQIESLRGQSHRSWRLWIRDDGSGDGTVEAVRKAAAEDDRIRLHPSDRERLGVTMSFSWLLERLPADAQYVMCCDQDDRWLPGKIATSLSALQQAEREGREPVLVHTDLTVVDRHLRVLHPSFWAYQGIVPQPATLRRLLAEDAVTGCTILMNRALLDEILPIPPVAPHHDRWIALVASLLGRVVSVPERTVLYRQHEKNVVGARKRESRTSTTLVREGVSTRRAGDFRDYLRRRAEEAAVLLRRFRVRISESEVGLLTAYSELPEQGPMRRKLTAYRLHALPERGFLRNLAVLLRS